MDSTALIVVYILSIPAAVIFGTVYLATHSAKRQTSLLRDVILITVMIAATVAGIVALFNLPTKLLQIHSDNLIFGIRVFLGVALMLIGVFLPNKIQKYFLMVLGLFMLAVELPFVFTNFGSYGALLIVGVAFIALIGVTIWLSLKGHHEQSS